MNLKEPNMLLLNCLNHTVLAWFLGGLPQNCQVLPTRARGFHDTTASLGTYRPTVYPILNLSLRGVNIIYPAPGQWSLLGEGASPRRCQCSRGLQGARKLSKAPRTPRKKHDMTSIQPNKKEIVSGRPRGRPYSAWYVSDAHLKA